MPKKCDYSHKMLKLTHTQCTLEGLFLSVFPKFKVIIHKAVQKFHDSFPIFTLSQMHDIILLVCIRNLNVCTYL